MRAMAMVMVTMLGAPAGVHGGAAAATPFELGAEGGIVVQVRLNGEGPFRFLVDTGSTHSAVTERTARRLNATAVARTVLDSSIGGGTVVVVRLQRLEVGSVDVSGVMPSVVGD